MVAMPSALVTAAEEIVPPGVEVVEGGPTRQDSVRLALRNVSAPEVLIHDAARPFATAAMVGRLLEALAGADGALLAVPVDETLKRVAGERVAATVDRSELWRSQTPQAFVTSRLKDAHDRAERESFHATDDAQLIERYGGTVAVVEGAPENIKITRAEDFSIAEALLRARV